MSDVNDKIICSSWLMFYLRSKNNDECITTVVKLGYIMLTKNIDHITVAARQESNISKKIANNCLEIFIKLLWYQVDSS